VIDAGFKHIVVVTLILIGTVSAQADADVQESLGRIEQLWGQYRDSQQSPAHRAKALEDIIAAYQRILAQNLPSSATARQILDGEIKWRLALANALVVERTIQARLAVEELGLAGAWAADLSSTINRAEKVLTQTTARLDQIIRHMQADGQFERNYVVTGLYLRATQAKMAVDYYRGWTSFYRALLTKDRPKRNELLQSTIEYLRVCCAEQPGEAPAVQSDGIQIRTVFRSRAVLLMVKALRYSDRLSEADKLLAWLERQSLDEQMAYKAALQRCRLLRDQGYYDTALAGLAQLRSWCDKKETTKQLSVQLTLAYLECTTRSAQARTAADRADLATAAELSRKRLQPLAKIFQAHSSDQVRSIIYEQIHRTRLADGYGQSWDELDSLEVLAMAVASAREDDISGAIKHFDALLARTDPESRTLYPDALWQAGKAVRDSDPLLACKYLERLTDSFPDSPQARMAVLLAVQVAANFRSAEPDSSAAEDVCLAALQRLMTDYPNSSHAKSWRFYWADLLLSRGDVPAAAQQFTLIGKSDPQYAAARYYQLQCRRRLLDSSQDISEAEKPAVLANLAGDFVSLDRYVLDPTSPADHRNKKSRSYGAMARLTAAEIFCTDLNQIPMCLMLLGTLSSDYADQDEVLSQALRYRIVALAKLGRLNEAVDLTLSLLGDGATDSAKVADAMLLRIREKFTDSELDSLSSDDRELADSWVRLAKARSQAARKSDLPPEQQSQELLASQEMLAYALFTAGKLDDALAILNELQQISPNSAEYIRTSGKVLLAQKNYDAASRQWRRLILGLKANSPQWFQAWYYALRTNFQAGGDRQQIIRRIKQLQSLDPEMGSKKNRSRFDTLMVDLAN